MSKTLTATAIFIGTIVGAGFLGIPYVLSKSGFLLGFIQMILVGSLILLTMLYFGETALRTHGNHQLTGYAEKYLGKKGKFVMLLALISGIYAALTAYLVAQGASWSAILFQDSSASLICGIAVWGIMAAITYFDVQALKKGETIGVILILVMMISITLISINKIDISNLQTINFNEFFTPFGVILFAFLGYSALPEVVRLLGKEKKSLKPALIWSHLLVFILYTLFAVIILGRYGLQTPEVATLSLGAPFILLGIITILTSYLALSVALIDTFKLDYGLGKHEAWVFTSVIPLALYIVLEINNKALFTTILGVGGIISGGLVMILILLMVKRAKVHGDRYPEYKIGYQKWILVLTIALLIIGTFKEIQNLL